MQKRKERDAEQLESAPPEAKPVSAKPKGKAKVGRLLLFIHTLLQVCLTTFKLLS